MRALLCLNFVHSSLVEESIEAKITDILINNLDSLLAEGVPGHGRFTSLVTLSLEKAFSSPEKICREFQEFVKTCPTNKKASSALGRYASSASEQEDTRLGFLDAAFSLYGYDNKKQADIIAKRFIISQNPILLSAGYCFDMEYFLRQNVSLSRFIEDETQKFFEQSAMSLLEKTAKVDSQSAPDDFLKLLSQLYDQFSHYPQVQCLYRSLKKAGALKIYEHVCADFSRVQKAHYKADETVGTSREFYFKALLNGLLEGGDICCEADSIQKDCEDSDISSSRLLKVLPNKATSIPYDLHVTTKDSYEDWSTDEDGTIKCEGESGAESDSFWVVSISEYQNF